MPTLLLTRPEADCEPLALALAEMGVETISAPLMKIDFHAGQPLTLNNVQGLLLTSANGARALAGRTDERDMPIFAVGDATAREAHSVGFTRVESALGDVDALAALVSRKCTPENGSFLHIAGKVQAGDLSGSLEAAGFVVRREILYSAEPVHTLSDNTVELIKDSALDGVVVYSPRTARILDQVIESQELSDALTRSTLFALSQNVSDATVFSWHNRIVARVPTQESLLKAIRACYY